jgi:inorganic pyrophosphatase
MNDDKLNELPITVKDKDPVTAIWKGVEDVTEITGKSTENTLETFDDWKNMETADDILSEMLIEDLTKTEDSAW